MPQSIAFGSLPNMIRLLILLCALWIFPGCEPANTSGSGPTDNKLGESNATSAVDSIDQETVLNAWFTELDEVNFSLHDTLLHALFMSKRTGKEVFVRRIAFEGEGENQPKHYRVSAERGGADNVVGVNYATREFRLDHYLPADGPTLDQIRQHLKNQSRIRELKKELGIFGVQ